VHEYELEVGVVGTPPMVRHLRAGPGTLLLPDCPGAAPDVTLLEGLPLRGMEAEVRSRFVGVQGCAHLNDLIRSLRYVEPMTGQFGGVHPQPANPPKEIAT